MTNKFTQQEIAKVVVESIASNLEISVDNLEQTAGFAEIGVDSLSAMAICADLTDIIGRDVDPTLLYKYKTIAALSAHLAT